MNGGANTNTYLHVNTSTTLTGGGKVSLSTTTNGGGGNAYLYLYNNVTLDNIDNTIQGSGIIYNSGTTINNHAGGVITANSAGSPLVNYLDIQYGTVNNHGVMAAANNGVLQLLHTAFTTDGTVSVASGGRLNIDTQYNQTGGMTQVNGILDASSAGMNVTGGTVVGVGTILGNVSLANSTMQPGDAVGMLTIQGDYSQTGGIFDVQISNLANGLLDIAGTAMLGPGANLNIDLLGGFIPTFGETFTIMEFASGSGMFANAPAGIFTMDGYKWMIDYNPTDIVLTFESSPSTVPEPSTFIMLVMGLSGFLGWRRVKRNSEVINA